MIQITSNNDNDDGDVNNNVKYARLLQIVVDM
jgi:hypothetical protein